MVGRTNAGGGGIPYSIASVTYPVGATCVCRSGTRIMRAKDKSGKAIFNIPYTGYWVVEATYGNNTAQYNFAINGPGELVICTLKFNLNVYSPGDDGSDWTTCLATTGNSSITFGANNAILKATFGSIVTTVTTKMLYNTPFMGGFYKTLTINIGAVSLNGASTTAKPIKVGVITAANKDSFLNNINSVSTEASVNFRESNSTYTVDLSNLSTETMYYIVVSCQAFLISGSSSTIAVNSCEITSIIAE